MFTLLIGAGIGAFGMWFGMTKVPVIRRLLNR